MSRAWSSAGAGASELIHRPPPLACLAYNPYANAPETSLGLAVGVLTVPIRPQDVGGRFRKQDVRFVLEAAK